MENEIGEEGIRQNISLMNNITFLPEGVIFRKAYEIGNGYLMPNNLFKDNVTIRGFEVHMIRYYIGVSKYAKFCKVNLFKYVISRLLHVNVSFHIFHFIKLSI
jgi:hypothetical protein